MPTAIINGKTVVIPKGHEVVEINGEKKIVSAGEAKKLLKAVAQAAKAAPAAAGGGGGPAVAAPKRDLRTNAEKVQDANLAEIDAAAAKNPCAGLWAYYRGNISFYRVEEVDGVTATVSCYGRQIVKKDRLEEFMAAHPGAEVVESEYVRVRKILPMPNFSTTACHISEVEVRYTVRTPIPITKGLLKEDGKRVALRELKAGAIVAVRGETVDVMKTVWVCSAPGNGHYKDKWVGETTSHIFAVVPEDRFESYEVAHALALE